MFFLVQGRQKKKKASLFVSRSCARIRFFPLSRLGDRARLLKIQENIRKDFDASVSQSKAFITIYFLIVFLRFVTQFLSKSETVIEISSENAIFIPSFQTISLPFLHYFIQEEEKKHKENNNM
jgi:hypothetical protein